MAGEIDEKEYARGRVEALRESLAYLQQERQKYQALEVAEMQQLAAWETILGEGEAPATAKPGAAMPESFSENLGLAFAETYGMKTSVARELIRRAKDHGISPKELSAAMEASGNPVSPSFASNALMRMKIRGEVIEEDGRYVWHTMVRKPIYSIDISRLDENKGAALGTIGASTSNVLNHLSMSREKEEEAPEEAP